MAAFKNSPRGQAQGRVCHRIDLPGTLGRRRRRREGGSQPPSAPRREEPTPEPPVVVPVPTPPVIELGQEPTIQDFDLSRLEEDLLTRTLARLRARVGEAPAGGGDAHRIEQLERRLRKLTGQLDERDRLLKALMRRNKGAGEDAGVASIYSEVQGIDDADDHAEAKKAMMSSIFEANLALRKKD